MIDEKTIEHVAKISHLNLTDAEKAKFTKQLADILKEFEVLDEIKVDGVEPCFQPVETKNVTREDFAKKSLTNEEALSQTEHKENGFFKGPKIV